MIAVGFSDNPDDFPVSIVTQHGINDVTLKGAKVISQNLLMIIDLLEKDEAIKDQPCTTNE